jgi:hypothetical protein
MFSSLKISIVVFQVLMKKEAARNDRLCRTKVNVMEVLPAVFFILF